MTAAAPAAVPSPSPPGRTLAAVPLVLLPLAVTAAAVVVLSAGDEVTAADVVRAALVVAFAVAGRALLRQPPLRSLGQLVLLGLSLASVEFLCSAALRQEAGLAWAEAAGSFAAPLVLAVAFHGLATLPDGELVPGAHRGAIGVAYVAAVVVGALRWGAQPDPPMWPLVALGGGLAIVGLAISHRRYRAARGAARQRMQWLGLALALVAETAVVVGALRLLVDWPPDAGVVIGGSLVLVAVALAASASPRLVGRVDRMLTHAVSVAGLSAVVVTVYVVVVVGLGRVPSDDERSL